MIINYKCSALCHFSDMNLPDEIKTIDDVYEVTTVINKSIFIAQIFPVLSEDDVRNHISDSKKKYYEASHHCYAFKLVNGVKRYSDAGEPNGTAGIRILNAIEHFHINNQLIIVSRIFGGIKLGVGPLGKAYYEAGYQVISSSKITKKLLYRKANISSEFEYVSIIHRILDTHKSMITAINYENTLEIEVLLPYKEISIIQEKLKNSGKNKIFLSYSTEFLYK